MPTTPRFIPTRAELVLARVIVTRPELFADEPPEVYRELSGPAWATLRANAMKPTAMILHTRTGGDAA